MTVDDQRLRWKPPPFGWKYSLVVCQKLVFGLTDGAFWNLVVLYFAYIDAVVSFWTKPFFRRAVCKVRCKLEQSRFLVNPKSVLEPSSSLDLVG